MPKLNEDIYIETPKGHPMYNHGYLKLNKVLYGLKQIGRMWNETLNNTFIKINFQRLTRKPCIYVKDNSLKEVQCIIAVYVDDILLAGKEREIIYVNEQIKMYFYIKDIGDVDFVIGIKFEKCHDGYILRQKQYIKDLFVIFKQTNSPPIKKFKI